MRKMTRRGALGVFAGHFIFFGVEGGVGGANVRSESGAKCAAFLNLLAFLGILIGSGDRGILLLHTLYNSKWPPPHLSPKRRRFIFPTQKCTVLMKK